MSHKIVSTFLFCFTLLTFVGCDSELTMQRLSKIEVPDQVNEPEADAQLGEGEQPQVDTSSVPTMAQPTIEVSDKSASSDDKAEDSAKDNSDTKAEDDLKDSDKSKGGDSSTPPPSDGDSSTPPPSDGDSSTPPPSDGDSSTPPPSDGDSSTPPPSGDNDDGDDDDDDDSSIPPTVRGPETPPIGGNDDGDDDSDDGLVCEKDAILLCHVPPGNPENAHNVCIGKKGNAAVAHMLHHDDYFGLCK